MEVDEDDFEQPSSSDNKAAKKRFEVKKVKWKPSLFLYKERKKHFYFFFVFLLFYSDCNGVCKSKYFFVYFFFSGAP